MTTELVNAVSSAFTLNQGYVFQTLAVVVPIALLIFGILFVWKISVNFFKGLAGSKHSKGSNVDDDDDYDDYRED